MTPVRLFSSDEIITIRTYFDALLEKYLADGADSYAISGAHARHAGVWDILTSPRIAFYLKQLLGSSIVGWGAHFFCKLPKDGKTVDWHQDGPYWPLTPPKSLTVWVAIDKVERSNACLKIVTASHRLGVLPRTDASEKSILKDTVSEAEQLGEVAHIELLAGQASFHSDMVLHGSDENISNRRRCGLALRYAPGDVFTHDESWRARGVIIAGPKLDHWGDLARPAQY